MVVFTDTKVILFISLTIATTAFAADPWLKGDDAGKCSHRDFLSDGRRAQCNPQGDHPCCGRSGWCGKLPAHCNCNGCIDYRKVPTTPKSPPTIAETSPTASPTTPPTTPTTIPTTTTTTTTTPPTTEPTTLESTTLEATTLELTTSEPTTLEATTTPPTMTPVSSTSIGTTAGRKVDGRGARKFPITSHEVTTTSTAAGGKAGGHGMEAISTTPAPHKQHESNDAWIGLVIALCVILLIGVACLINFIRNKRKSGSQTISLTEAGVGNASAPTSKKTTLTYSTSGTLPSKDRNPQITVTTPHTDSQDKAGSEASTDKVDGGKSNAAFSENQDEAVSKEESKKDQVEGDNDILFEKDNSNDELNTNFEEQAEGKGLSNDAFKEDEVVKSDG